jgi:hypothetical protein
MPKRKTHEDISLLLLGKKFSKVHKVMDSPSKVLGRRHRIVLHSIPEGLTIGLLLTGEVKGAAAGVLHIITDVVDSGAKKAIKKLIINRGDKNWLVERKTEKAKPSS